MTPAMPAQEVAPTSLSSVTHTLTSVAVALTAGTALVLVILVIRQLYRLVKYNRRKARMRKISARYPHVDSDVVSPTTSDEEPEEPMDAAHSIVPHIVKNMSRWSMLPPPRAESRISLNTSIAPGSPSSCNGGKHIRTPTTLHHSSSTPLVVALGDGRSPTSSFHALAKVLHCVSRRPLLGHAQAERQRLLGRAQQLDDTELPYPSDMGARVMDVNGDIMQPVSRSPRILHQGCVAVGRSRLTQPHLKTGLTHATLCHINNGPLFPYLKCALLPDRRTTCKTNIIKKTTDPIFNEMFSYDVPYAQLPNRMLQRHGLIGNVIMRDLLEKSDLSMWTEFTMKIVHNQEKNDYGDLLLYIAYSLPLRKLYLTVSKAYNLRPMDITGASDPYVKAELCIERRRVKVRKTSVKRANLNPVYRECLEFDLAPSQIADTNLIICAMDWDRIGRDDLLGVCFLGRESPTEEGRAQWEQCFTSILDSNGHPLLASATSTPTPDVAMNGDNNRTQNAPVTSSSTVQTNGHVSPPLFAKISTHSGITATPGVVGTWHSLLGEIPQAWQKISKN